MNARRGQDDSDHPITLVLGEVKGKLELVLTMIEQDRSSAASYRVRTREALDELRDKLNPALATMARVIPIVERLEDDHNARLAEAKVDRRWRALLYSVALGLGGFLMWLADQGIKLLKH